MRWVRPTITVAVAVTFALASIGADAAVRFRNRGADTLGAPDALASLPEACEASGARVFARAGEVSECIAYYATRSGSDGRRAVLYFEGDVGAEYRADRRRLEAHLKSLMAALEQLARSHRVPFIFIARPGTFGSTGDHRRRRWRQEYDVLNAAVDRIAASRGLTELVLAGQSGGATAVAALLALGRRDVVCATPASGGYDLEAMFDWHYQRRVGEPRPPRLPTLGDGPVSIMNMLPGLAADRRRRLFVIGDPKDTVTPFAFQRRFAEAVRAGGHHAELIEARGSGRERHGLGHVSLQAAGLCATDRPDKAIRAAIGRVG